VRAGSRREWSRSCGQKIEAAVFDGVPTNPDVASVERGAEALRPLADAAVIALGGGSSLDAAKAIALLGPNKGGARDYTFGCKPDKPGQPLFAVPTTAGTGSETNMFAVITDPELGRKILIAHASVQPVAIVLDPELGVGVPPAVTASCGMDVLTHAIEALTSNRRNPYSDALALRAIAITRRIFCRALRRRLGARGAPRCSWHLTWPGLAFFELGPRHLHHAIGHPLSARFRRRARPDWRRSSLT
jgi:alcohol dehydrogenase class IV